MNSQKRKIFSWRLKLILALGAFAGLVLMAFGNYVASLHEDPLGPIPLSWGFKQQAARAAAFFNMEHLVNSSSGEPPPIDATVPMYTEYALFALG